MVRCIIKIYFAGSSNESENMSEIQSISPAADEKRKILGELIAQKRGKGGTTQLEAKQFTDAWVALTKTVGVNDETVALIYDGFKFAAGEPLYQYVSESKSKTAYISLFSAKPTVANDQGIAFKAAINLFALELPKPTSSESVSLIVRSIPKLSVNKDGKAFGTLGRSIGKLLIKPLSRKKIHPDIHLSRKDASAILSVLRAPVEAFAKNPKVKSVDSSAALSLLAWLENQASLDNGNETSLHTDQSTQSLSPEKPATTSSSLAQTVVNDRPTQRSVTECSVRVIKNDSVSAIEPTSLASAAEHVVDESASSWKSEGPASTRAKEHGMPEVIAFLTAYQSKFENLQAKCDRSQSEKYDALNRVSVLEQELRNARQENSELHEHVTALAGRCSDLQFELNSQQGANESMRGNLEAMEEMLATIDRRDTRQADESVRRLSRELKVEYADFMDAAELPMSVDLGENMRDQLHSVFQIIKANGIEL